MNLLVNRGDTLRLRAARAIAEMLESCGLKVTVVDLEARDYQDAYRAGMFDLYLGQTKLSANMDLSAFFSPWGVLSYGGMDDSTIYAMCKEALENSGNYYNLSQMIMDDGRLCPVLFSSYAVYADRGLISGLEPSRDDVFHYDLGRTLEDALDTHGPADAPIPTETEDPSAE